jgi:hypothetical protein
MTIRHHSIWTNQNKRIEMFKTDNTLWDRAWTKTKPAVEKANVEIEKLRVKAAHLWGYAKFAYAEYPEQYSRYCQLIESRERVQKVAEVLSNKKLKDLGIGGFMGDANVHVPNVPQWRDKNANASPPQQSGPTTSSPGDEPQTTAGHS